MSKRFIQRLNFDELRWETQTRVLSCRDLVMYEHRVLHPNNTNQFQTSLIFHITDSKKMLEAANEENLHWHSFLSPMFDSCSLEPQRALGDNTIPSAAAALLLSWWDFFSLQREIKEKFPFTTSRIRPAAGYLWITGGQLKILSQCLLLSASDQGVYMKYHQSLTDHKITEKHFQNSLYYF